MDLLNCVILVFEHLHCVDLSLNLSAVGLVDLLAMNLTTICIFLGHMLMHH